jgi:hypothetical protein
MRRADTDRRERICLCPCGRFDVRCAGSIARRDCVTQLVACTVSGWARGDWHGRLLSHVRP